jgi:hypothetical protein
VFSPQRRELHIVHADADRLTTIDFQERSLRTQIIRPRPTWIERLLALTADIAEAKYWPEGATKSAVISPEGTRLYLIGQTWERIRHSNGELRVSETALGLRVVELYSGYLLDSRETHANRISLSPDRRYLILQTGWQGTVEVLAADNLEPLGQVDGWEVERSRRLDGEPILIAIRYGSSLNSLTRLALLSPEAFELQSSWSATGIGIWLTLP